MKPVRLLILFGLGLPLLASRAAEAPPKTVPPPKVRYKEGRALQFDKLEIDGRGERPAISVVTGNAQGDGDGLLRLRESFVDRLAVDAGEEIP